MKRYQNIRILKNREINNGARYMATVRYPTIPLSVNDIYVITTDGDRLDLLANQYYQDYTLYWIISLANPFLKQNSLTIPVGTQLRIPTQVEQVIASYNKLNEL